MRILLISNGFPPRQWAGTETYTAGIAHELSRRGHHVFVLCPGDWDTGAQYYNGYSEDCYDRVVIRRLNLNWWRAPDPSRFLYENPVVEEILITYLKEIKPDLVHVTSCEKMSASVLHVVKEASIPLVLSLTDFWFLCPRYTLLRSDGKLCNGQTTASDCLLCFMEDSNAYKQIKRLLPQQILPQALTQISKESTLTRMRGLRGWAGDMQARKNILQRALVCPDCRITASQFVHDVFVANGFHQPILVKYYGHDLSWLGKYSGKNPSSVIRIGYIGQISPHKGVHLLLEAVRLLPDLLGSRFTLSIYGNIDKEPAYGASLRKLAEGSPAIRFCGTYAHEESASVYAGVDVLVVPSIWYDFPLIIHEAFATKTPVIASNLGGMAESVHQNVNGLLFERGDVSGLAGQLRRVILEPGLLEKLQSGIQPVKTIGEEVTELEEIYTELTVQYKS